MNNLIANYERILEVLRKILPDTLLSYQRRTPRLKDLELISLVLMAEFMGLDSENHLFRNLPNEPKTKIERSVYNRRKMKLSFVPSPHSFQQFPFEQDFYVFAEMQKFVFLQTKMPENLCNRRTRIAHNQAACKNERLIFGQFAIIGKGFHFLKIQLANVFF
jgi:hypothetical protein